MFPLFYVAHGAEKVALLVNIDSSLTVQRSVQFKSFEYHKT